MKQLKKIAVVGAALALVGGLAACTEESSGRDEQRQESEAKFDGRRAPDVTGDAEYNNYLKAQEEVYDNPTSIIYCTVFPSNPSIGAYTVPIAGKLTSSSVSYYPNQSPKFSSGGSFQWMEENQSVDGMYHGSPAPYRYGFTPGGQYVEFLNTETFCSTQLTEFAKQTLSVSTVAPEDSVTAEAEKKLAEGDAAGAQELLDEVAAANAGASE